MAKWIIKTEGGSLFEIDEEHHFLGPDEFYVRSITYSKFAKGNIKEIFGLLAIATNPINWEPDMIQNETDLRILLTHKQCIGKFVVVAKADEYEKFLKKKKKWQGKGYIDINKYWDGPITEIYEEE